MLMIQVEVGRFDRRVVPRAVKIRALALRVAFSGVYLARLYYYFPRT